MPRKRKYDYQTDYPVTLFVKVPVAVLYNLEQLGISQKEIEQIVSKHLVEYTRNLENNRKKD
jgi:hypothetical protein